MAFQEIIDKAPQGIKDIFNKDEALTKLIEAAFVAGREEMRVEIAEYVMRSHQVDNKFISDSSS
jgi:hypothetical protein